MVHDGCNYYYSGLFFAVLRPPPLPSPPPLRARKMKMSKTKKTKKTPQDIVILHKCTKIHDHMLYCS